jgi:nickel-dependent lactate racemase
MDQLFFHTPIKYKSECIDHFIPKKANCTYLQVMEKKFLKNIEKKLEYALNFPLNSPPFTKLIEICYTKGNPIVLLVDDNSRPNIHTRALLPLIESKMIEHGVQKEDIRLMIATGTHPPPTPTQIKEKILKDLYDHWENRIWVHDCDKVSLHEDMGFSSLGTPIFIDKRVLSSSFIVPVSDSEYHYFAGVAGSVKLFVPGISARQTVRANHTRIFDLQTGFTSECRMGNIENNICIQDIREIVQLFMEKGNHSVFVIDAIMHKGRFVDIIAGHPLDIHDSALKALAKIRNVPIEDKADLVIVSKPSVNFYQAGKGINAASHAVKEGGKIILLAECYDGIGPKDYLETMNAVKDKSYQEAMQWVIHEKCTETTFEIGIQNSVDLLRILQLTQGGIYVYSELDSDVLRNIFRVNPLDVTKKPTEALSSFVADFLKEKPDGLIYVFEDFNILPKVNRK